MGLYQQTFYSEELSTILSEERFIELMLRVEAGLARAQAAAGTIPVSSAEVIEKCAQLKYIDIDRLKNDIALGGNAAIPLVKQLTTLVKSTDFEASKYVHLGATSQDIIDTATVLQIGETAGWIKNKISLLAARLKHLAQTHRNSLMMGRTLMQQAKPITFGLKAALWYKSVQESDIRIHQAAEKAGQIQMAGAVGTGNKTLNERVVNELAESLSLLNNGSWQSSRGNLLEFTSSLAILCGDLGKIARDISLLMQTEIGEAYEGAAEGKGGSSTMPHKRNPVNCALIISNATRTPGLLSTLFSSMMQENERSAGLWHAEWETLESLMALTGGALEKCIDLIDHLEVDNDRMLQNMEITQGLIYAENVMLALAPELGKLQAHETVEKACKKAIKTGTHLKSIIEELSQKPANLDELFSPAHALENSHKMMDLILAKAHES